MSRVLVEALKRLATCDGGDLCVSSNDGCLAWPLHGEAARALAAHAEAPPLWQRPEVLEAVRRAMYEVQFTIGSYAFPSEYARAAMRALAAPIPRGVRYVNIGALWEGSWETLRVHWECLVLWGAVQQDLCGGHGNIVIGGLDEELRNYGYSTDDRGEWSDGNGGDDGGEWISAAAEYQARLEAIRDMYAATPSGPR